jgi:type II secretory pathway component PulF
MYKVEYFEDNVKQTTYLLGNSEDIRAKLSKDGKVVLSIKEQKYFLWVNTKPKDADIAVALKTISDLLNSGIRLTEAIKSVLNTMPSPKMKRLIAFMLDAASEGREVSSGMDPHVFGSTIVSMIKAGEKSGKLASAFDLAASHIKIISEMKKDMYKKISYPLIVFIVGIISLLINTTVIVPKILGSELFQMTLRGQIPISVQILNVISYVIPFFTIVMLAASASTYIYYKQNQEEAEKFLIRIPYMREFLFYRDFFISFFGLSKLLESGEKLDVSLETISKSSAFYITRKEFKSAWERLKNGESFVSGFKHITDIERIMLGTSLNIENVQNIVQIVSKRFYDKYEEKLKGLAPKIYAAILIFTVLIFILVTMAILVPYGQILGGIRA